MIIIQEEILKAILNSDATVERIALVILLFFIAILWRSKMADEKYIREQDKANIELFLTMTNTVDDVYKETEKNTNKIDRIRTKIDTLLNIITERLKKS